MGNSTFLQKNYVFFAPAVLDTTPEESSMSDGWKLFKHPSSVFTEVTTGFFICFSPVSSTSNTLGIDVHQGTWAAGMRSWKVLLVFRCTADVTDAAGAAQLLPPASAGRAGARNSSQDFLPFSPAHRALLPLVLLPALPPAAFGRKQMESCRLWGMVPHQAWSLHVLGQRELPTGT